MDYGYVNPKGQEAIKNEILYQVKAYFEAKELMRTCKNLHVFIALKHFCEEIKG